MAKRTGRVIYNQEQKVNMPVDKKPMKDKASSSSSSRPNLGTGMAEKAAKALENRKSTLDKQLKDYGV